MEFLEIISVKEEALTGTQSSCGPRIYAVKLFNHRGTQSAGCCLKIPDSHENCALRSFMKLMNRLGTKRSTRCYSVVDLFTFEVQLACRLRIALRAFVRSVRVSSKEFSPSSYQLKKV